MWRGQLCTDTSWEAPAEPLEVPPQEQEQELWKSNSIFNLCVNACSHIRIIWQKPLTGTVDLFSCLFQLLFVHRVTFYHLFGPHNEKIECKSYWCQPRLGLLKFFYFFLSKNLIGNVVSLILLWVLGYTVLVSWPPMIQVHFWPDADLP